MARTIVQFYWKLYLCEQRLRADLRGQDLIEYALMSGLIGTAVVALSPQLASAISSQFSRVGTPLSQAASQGS